MKRIIITLFVVIGMTCSISAQNIKRPDSYNYNRGVEAIQNNNAEEALEYLNKELEDNPNNGYALAWIATVRNYQEEYGRALTAVDLAIKHIPKRTNNIEPLHILFVQKFMWDLVKMKKHLSISHPP